MSEKLKKNKQLTAIPLALMCLTSVFMFTNIPRGFFLMGYSAIPWYVLSAITFFVPFAFMIAEYGAAFKDKKGGIYSWMEAILGAKYAFITIIMWYVGWLIWVILTCSSIWVHVSTIIFGKDTTSNWSILGLSAGQTIGILAILFAIGLTFVATKGLDKIIKVTSIGGLSVAFINIVAFLGAIIALISHHGEIAQPITMQAFIQSPNSNYLSFVSVISFVAFSIVAYGGIEVVGGVSDQTENPEKTFPKGVLIGAAFIAIGYAVGIFAVGMYTNWNAILSGKNINMVNSSIVVMINLGYYIGVGFGMNQASALVLGAWVGRLVALSMFLTYIGALVTVSYSPIKQIIEGTPKEMWPGKIGQVDDGIPKNAMWAQCIIMVIFLALISFGGQGANAFFNKLVIMTNVAMTLPYMFITFAFPKFKKDKSIKKPFEIYKTYKSSLIWAIVSTFTVGFANFFLIIQPATVGDISTTIWTIVGPVIFAIMSLLLYSRYEKITKFKKENNNMEI